MNLKAALNNKLRTALVGVKLPPPARYDDWVEAVKEVAMDLEGLADYAPKGATQTVTKLGAPKSGVGQIFPRQQTVDSEGDIRMTGTNAILAARGGSGQNTETSAIMPRNNRNGRLERGARETQDERPLPRAPWRSQDEVRRLIREGVCLRCTQGGHRATNCPKFRRALAPRSGVNAVTEVDEKPEGRDSENDYP